MSRPRHAYVIATARTRLRLPTGQDAPFFLELLNDVDFVRFTGDRGIRDLAGATSYITERLLAQHAAQGFTLYVVERQADRQPLGVCGLVQRDYLNAPDIGFGFLTRHCRQGYGLETARAVQRLAHETLGLPILFGITQDDNIASISLLESLGLIYQHTATLPGLAQPQRIYRTPTYD